MNTFYNIAQTIEYATLHKDHFIVAFDYNEKCSRRYKTYEGADKYICDHKYKDKHAFEVLKKWYPCKLYMDIEYANEDPTDLKPNTLNFEEL